MSAAGGGASRQPTRRARFHYAQNYCLIRRRRVADMAIIATLSHRLLLDLHEISQLKRVYSETFTRIFSLFWNNTQHISPQCLK